MSIVMAGLRWMMTYDGDLGVVGAGCSVRLYSLSFLCRYCIPPFFFGVDRHPGAKGVTKH